MGSLDDSEALEVSGSSRASRASAGSNRDPFSWTLSSWHATWSKHMEWFTQQRIASEEAARRTSRSLSYAFDSKLNLSLGEDSVNVAGAFRAPGLSRVKTTTNAAGSSFLSRMTSASPASNLPDDEEELLDGMIDVYAGEPEENNVFCGPEMEAEDTEGDDVNVGRGTDSLSSHPCRKLFVRNIPITSDDAELLSLFKEFGDVADIYTKCKFRGFVLITFYDLRDAQAAMRALQSYSYNGKKLDIGYAIPKRNPSPKDANQGTLVVFNLDSSLSHDMIIGIFGAYGEVKEIRETYNKHHHKFIEFYDTRASEAALRLLNRSFIAGKQIKIEYSRPGGSRRSFKVEPHKFSSPGGSRSPVLNATRRSNRTRWQPNRGSLPNNVSPLNLYGGSPFSGASSAVFRAEDFYNDHSAEQVFSEGEISPYAYAGTSYGSQYVWGSPRIWTPPTAPPTAPPAAPASPFAGSHIPFPHHNSPGASVTSDGTSSPRFDVFSPRFGASLEGPGGISRGRRPENSISATESKEFQLDMNLIVSKEDTRTTLMMKNIPNKYTAKMLLEAIDEQHRGTYDFLYLPIDFKNNCNVGYAFINLIASDYIPSFYTTFEGRKWDKFNSEKVATLAYGRIQGKLALISHFQNSSLVNEDKQCRPLVFISDGPNAGDEEPFPFSNRMVG